LNDEQQLLADVEEALHRKLGLEIEKKSSSADVDAVWQIRSPGASSVPFCVKAKKHVAKRSLGLLLSQAVTLGEKLLLATEYVDPVQAEQLKEAGLCFADKAGNAFLRGIGLFVFVKGNRPPEVLSKRTVSGMRPAHLRLIYLLLTEHTAADRPIRELARAARISVGSVQAALGELTDNGFLLDRGRRGRRLLDRDALEAQWIEGYANRLRPKLTLGHFRMTSKIRSDWQAIDPLEYGCQWSGEVAASIRTQYLRPGSWTLFTDAIPTSFVKDVRLARDPEGTVEFLSRFWEPGREEKKVVPDLLIRADLIAIGDPRTVETARLLHENP